MSPPGASEPSTKRAGVFGVLLRNSKRACSESSSAASCCADFQRAGAAHVDALEATRALPRIDRGREEAAGAGLVLLHGVEEGPRLGDREGRQDLGDPAEIALQNGVVGVDGSGGRRQHLVERLCLLA